MSICESYVHNCAGEITSASIAHDSSGLLSTSFSRTLHTNFKGTQTGRLKEYLKVLILKFSSWEFGV